MRYSDEQRQGALDCLAANEGDFRQTSEETGISVATLKKWAQQEQPDRSRGDALAELRSQLAAFEQSIRDNPPPEDLLERAGTQLLLSMTRDAIRISESMGSVIDAAPLNQRATALNQLIDKIIKLSKALPQTGEQVIRIEYVWPDGTTHDAPPWAEEDSE